MSIIPTKQLINAYDYCNKDNNSHSINYGHFQLDKSTYSDNKVIWTLYHYNTWILTVFVYNDGHKVIEKGHGYSNSDRDNINGLFTLLGMSIKAHNYKDGWKFTNLGKNEHLY